MYPPSPRGLGNDAGSVTFISCLADAIVRPYAVGEIGEKDIRVVDIQYGLTVLKSLCADENLLSMWSVYTGSANACNHSPNSLDDGELPKWRHHLL
jgi:hypothetical protein